MKDQFEKERKELLELGTRMFEIYHKLPQADSKRKILGGYDDKGWGYNLMLFQGKKEDMSRVQELLNSMDR